MGQWKRLQVKPASNLRLQQWDDYTIVIAMVCIILDAHHLTFPIDDNTGFCMGS